ncbi:MAG TPA: substrate-binding domain-containing protein [Solirubrobacteraceae bacterium]|jgi:ABC-type sugar transport system substrate-binding protein|nr:substrate-binding domain-containing protein [Solirubrobacteraceae bacterium]
MAIRKVRFVALGAIACLAVLIGAVASGSANTRNTGSAAAASVKGKTVLFIGVNPTNSYVLQAWNTAKQLAAKDGLKIKEDGVTAGNPQEEVNAIEDAASANQYDGYVIVPQNATEDVPAIKQLVATGKPVVGDSIALGPNLCTDKPQVKGMAGAVVTPTCEVASQGFGPATKLACKGLHPCNIGWIVGLVGFPGEEKMFAGVQRAAASIGAKIYQSAPTNYVISSATTETQSLLTAHPDINVLVTGAGPQIYLGASKAELPAKLRIVADGAVAQELQALKTGKPDIVAIVTGNGLPKSDTQNSMNILVKALANKKYRNVGVDSIQAAGIPMLFTKANASAWKSFKPQWSAAG